jgi:hypothetical protein
MVYSGSLLETGSIYSAQVTLTGTEEYRVKYITPSSYYNGFENIIVDEDLAILSGNIVDVYDAIIPISASNTQVYNAVMVMSSSVDFVSGSMTYLSSSMVDLSASNVTVYNAVMVMSSSVSYMSSSVDYLSSSMVELSASTNQMYNAVNTMTGSITQMSSSLDVVEKISTGRWVIAGNQMSFYAQDGVTLVTKFNLFDATGVPASMNVFERRPV